MAREYRNISQYEKEIVELRKQGFTFKEIGERYGFTFKQLHNFFTRYNKKQDKLKAKKSSIEELIHVLVKNTESNRRYNYRVKLSVQ